MTRPPATPEAATRLAKSIADIYAQAAAELIRVVARRVAAGLPEPRNATTRAQLSELLRLRRDAERVAARAQAAGGREAVRIVTEAYAGGLRASPAGNQRAVQAIAAALAGELDQAGPAILRWAEDVYRRVTAETAPLAVVTGGLTRREAAARALDRYATLGVTGFTDAGGSVWRIESYAEMAARTATQRAHLAGTVDRLQGQGRDLVMVTDSPAECPRCRPFEGRVYSLSGDSRDYPPLGEAVAGGLFHPNCTHTVTAYVEGLTRTVRPRPDPQAYEDKQRLRVLERRVRESRRRVAALEPLGDTERLRRNRLLLARRREALTEHLHVARLRHKGVTSAFRTRISGW